MNKILFSEGGQPVFLDDIKHLQDITLEVCAELLRSLSGDNGGYLLHPENYSIDSDHNTTTASANSIVYQGEIIPFEGKTFPSASVLPNIKICLRQESSDPRVFENGQTNHCRGGYVAYLSTDATGVEAYFTLKGMPTLSSKLSPFIKEWLDDQASQWTPLQVTFCNGYSGTVEYRELTDCYRIRINISSRSSYEDVQGSIVLFETDGSGWPGHYRDQRSGLFGAGGDDMSNTAYISFGQDGEAVLCSLNANPTCWSPGDCSVKTIFDIPK